MMIELNFEFTKSELAEAQQRLVPVMRILSIVSVVLGLFFLWLGYHAVSQGVASATSPPSRTANMAEVIAAIIPFTIFVVIYLPVWFSLRKRLSKLRENPLLLGPRRVIIDDAGIRSVHSLSETFYRWEAVEKVFVTKQLYLLRVWSIVLIIPKRAIPADQLKQFDQLVHSRVMQRTGGFPVHVTPPPLPVSSPQQG